MHTKQAPNTKKSHFPAKNSLALRKKRHLIHSLAQSLSSEHEYLWFSHSVVDPVSLRKHTATMKTIAALISMVLVHSSAVALLSVSEESVRGATISKGRSRKATFVGVVDYRRAEPPIGIASDKTDKDRRTHYGNPTTNGGCMKDERPLKIEGIEGEICAPKCTAFQACPSDLPSGVAATPQCALKDPDARSAQMYCALIFNPSEDEKKNASSGEAAGSSLLRGAVPKDKSSSDSCDCGEASCQIVNGVGICTYLE